MPNIYLKVRSSCVCISKHYFYWIIKSIIRIRILTAEGITSSHLFPNSRVLVHRTHVMHLHKDEPSQTKTPSFPERKRQC